MTLSASGTRARTVLKRLLEIEQEKQGLELEKEALEVEFEFLVGGTTELPTGESGASIQAQVLSLMLSKSTATWRNATLTEILGHRPGAIAVALHRLVESGMIAKIRRGYYRIPNSEERKVMLKTKRQRQKPSDT